MSDTQGTALNQPLRLYGRRKGKRLRPGRKAVLDRLLPQLRIDLPALTGPIQLETLFPFEVRSVWLEIGFGAGEHLAAQAQAHPDVGFIGAEIFENGVASLLRHCDAQVLNNIRVFNDDVRALLPQLDAESLGRVFLLFPDPWPKARHAKRRFICDGTLTELARIMAPGAELRIATDHPVYVRWCLRHGPVHPTFHWKVTGPQDWRQSPDEMVATRYFQKAEREGRTPVFLTLVRTAS